MVLSIDATFGAVLFGFTRVTRNGTILVSHTAALFPAIASALSPFADFSNLTRPFEKATRGVDRGIAPCFASLTTLPAERVCLSLIQISLCLKCALEKERLQPQCDPLTSRPCEASKITFNGKRILRRRPSVTVDRIVKELRKDISPIR